MGNITENDLLVSEVQSDKNKEEGKITGPISRAFFGLFLLMTVANLLCNFLALPIVKYIYVIQAASVFVLAFVSPISRLIYIFLILSLFEGQGRVLWGYNPLFRLLFDILLGILVLRAMIIKKNFFSRDVVSGHIRGFFFLHIIWFFLELFNPNGAGVFASLATAKFYIFPLLLFFLFLNNPIRFNDRKSQFLIFYVYLVLVSIAILTIVQNIYGADFMDSVSPYYSSLFPKYKIFRGDLFRPWGTTFVPGGMGVLYFLMIGFFFVIRPGLMSKNLGIQVLLNSSKWLGLLLIFFSSFIGQVRSATLKMLGIMLIFVFLKFIGSRVKARWAMIGLVSLILGGGFLSTNLSVLLPEEANIESALNRWDGLSSSKITDHRAGLSELLDNLAERVEMPFGFGMGMTQSFLPAYQARRDQYIHKPNWWFWTMDNLWAFLILELGVGAIFYMGLILGLNLSLFSMLFTVYKWRDNEAFTMLVLSFTLVSVVTLFSWGAVNIPFNPVSFFYWMWAALGFNAFRDAKKRRRMAREKGKTTD